LEAGLIGAAALLVSGLGLGFYALSYWNAESFGALSASLAMRLVIPSGTLILLGFQTASSAFFISILEIRATRHGTSVTEDIRTAIRAA
jgi:hypothetical protein